MRRFLSRWTVVVSLALFGAIPATRAMAAETVLFIGNSFTFGAMSPVWKYKGDIVADLNNGGVGGVPALFKSFTQQAGLDYIVSLETVPGQVCRHNLRSGPTSLL